MLKSILKQFGLTTLSAPRRRYSTLPDRYQVLALPTPIEHQKMVEEPALKGITLLSAQGLKDCNMVLGFLSFRFYLPLFELPPVSFSVLKLSATDIFLLALALEAPFGIRDGRLGVGEGPFVCG